MRFALYAAAMVTALLAALARAEAPDKCAIDINHLSQPFEMNITTNQPVELNFSTHGAEQSGRRVYTYTDVLGTILPAGTSVVADILIKFDENRYDTNGYFVTLSTLGSNATFLAVVTFNYHYYIPHRFSGEIAFNTSFPIQSSETCTTAFLAKRLDNIVVRKVLERGQDCGDWPRYAANATCTNVLPLPDEFYLYPG